jgi:hypothetical protein
MAILKGYKLYWNGKFVGFVQGQNKKTRIQALKDRVVTSKSGTWEKTNKGYTYTTPRGNTLVFEATKALLVTEPL